MKTTNLKNEPIYFFRSERNGNYYNPSKFFVDEVKQISLNDINIMPFIGVIDDVGNKMDVTGKDIRNFEKGKKSRLVFEWDGIYDTSYYIRESGLTDEEKTLIEKRLNK